MMAETAAGRSHDMSAEPSDAGEARRGWVAAGGVIGAILASSCCIVPLVLVTFGVSGAWIGNLTAFDPYKRYFAAVTLVLVGLGFWLVYFRDKPVCAEGSYCARPQSTTLTKAALWFATLLVLLALTVELWAPLLY